MGTDIVTLMSQDNTKKALAAVMPAIMNKDRFMSMALAATKMQAASKYVVDKRSILVSVYDAAKLGLELNDTLGHAYLVPFKGKCTLIPGYKGLLELVRRSGRISDMHAFIVYEKDEWEYWVDEAGTHFKYRPTYEKDRGKPICGVSVARFKEEGVSPSVHVMPYHKILRIKNTALARTPSSPWKDYEEEMARKTAIRAHCKTLPMTPEVARAVELDEKVELDDASYDVPEELNEVIADGVFEEVPEDKTCLAPIKNEPADLTEQQRMNIEKARGEK